MGVRKYKRDCALEAKLTVAEERVLTLISQSMSNREAAHKLGTSPAAVKRHLENILRKLPVRNRIEAAIYHLSMDRSCARNKAIVHSLNGENLTMTR